MKYHSTRDVNKKQYTSAEVIMKGLADDGGLFVPEYIPTISEEDIKGFASLSYPELAATVLSKFLTDYEYNELLNHASAAYSKEKFPEDECPVRKVGENYFLELWHGPTCAFKDMALQIMPRLLSAALYKTGEKRTAIVLVATSGDTGKAALEGYKNIDNIKISVFYPEQGVSTVQKLQMVTQDGNNVNVCGVDGNFDDIQTEIKRIFNSEGIAKNLNEQGYFLSSANSINFGRLAPQIVYYIKAYCDLVSQNEINLGDKINVCVPTGNFGNILAAYIAKLMGLPIDKLICASNSNNILTDFLTTGRYDRNGREFRRTMSPSMDILISSNLERLLYLVAGAEKTALWMKSLNENGYYEIDAETKALIDESFVGYYSDEYTTMTFIRDTHDDYEYLIDTHTGVAVASLDAHRKQTGDNTKTVIASTANPFKFAKDVHDSIYDDIYLSDIRALYELQRRSGEKIPRPLCDIEKRQVNFSGVVSPDGIYDAVIDFISNENKAYPFRDMLSE